jgi:hypothetical protein
MKANLTQRDWTLVAGILVAVIVALLIFIFSPPLAGPDAEPTSFLPALKYFNYNWTEHLTNFGKHSAEALFQSLFL